MAKSWLSEINSKNFENKSVLLIGAGEMGFHYAQALSQMNIRDVIVISQGTKNVDRLCNKYGFKSLSGGYQAHLSNLKEMDLVIVATPTPLLIPAAKTALDFGQNNILIEKPGSVYHSDLISLHEKIKSQRVRIAWQRLLYPSFQKLKQLVEDDGGITSCKFDFTERIHTIEFEKYAPEIYNRWGITNSLHIISMVFDLIGIPKELKSYQTGKLEWHKSGSCFVGSGISEKDIPFSYHADWSSGGRWEIEIMTEKNAYRLLPIEELHVCTKGTTDWQVLPLEIPYPEVKQGIAEEIVLMFAKEAEQRTLLVTLKKSAELNRVAEKIFGYY